jgi:hypothetical protein
LDVGIKIEAMTIEIIVSPNKLDFFPIIIRGKTKVRVIRIVVCVESMLS